MTSFRVSPAARADLKNIWTYTATTWNIEQAERYITLMNEAFARIASGESAGRSVNELRRGYYRLAVGSHFIFYVLKGADKRVEIMRVLHQHMDIPARLRGKRQR